MKTKTGSTDDLNGFMDETTELTGELRFRNTFRVDGRVKGKIFSDNTLIVGETADVEADIECAMVSIRGKVTGRIQARQKIELLAGAKVLGTLAAPRLVIEEGALFQGDCDMKSAAKGAVVTPILGRTAQDSRPV